MKTLKCIRIVVIAFFLFCTTVPVFGAEGEFREQVENLARKLTSSTMGEVLGTEGELIFINLGEKDFIREGTVFEVVRLGDAIVSGSTTFRKERPIGDIEVTRVRQNMSYAKAVSSYAQIKQGDRVYQKKKKISRVALTEFPYRSSYNDLTKNIYERLTIYFAQKGLQVVERSKLNQVLQEQKISYSGIMDVSTAQKLGKLVGAQAVLVGSVSDLRDDVAINARLVDVEKGTFMTAALVELQKNPQVQAMLGTGNRSKSARSGQMGQTRTGTTGSSSSGQSAVKKGELTLFQENKVKSSAGRYPFYLELMSFKINKDKQLALIFRLTPKKNQNYGINRGGCYLVSQTGKRFNPTDESNFACKGIAEIPRQFQIFFDEYPTGEFFLVMKVWARWDNRDDYSVSLRAKVNLEAATVQWITN